MPSAVQLVSLFATTLALYRHSFAQSSAGIIFTPTSNQTVPSNSFDNVTYNCEVDANRILIWEVNMIPLEGNDVMDFEAKGVFKVDQGTNQSTLIITRDAREKSSWQPISVRCTAFTRMPLQSDFSSFSYVITQYVVDCGTLTNPDNGEVNHTAGTTIGQLATYSCNIGFNLVGNNTQTCQVAGWSESAPTCQIVDCGALSNPVNGSVHYTAGTTFRQKANYSCNTGYNLVGDNTRTCEATGEWSGSAPTCQAVNCGTLTNPTNGSVTHTAGTTFGQTATYSCNTGYNLVGGSTRTCQATGVWSGSAPNCQVVDCGALINPANGLVSHTGTTFGQTATYSCNTGYNLVGDNTRTCQATRMWTGSVPTCQAVNCGTLTNPTNGQVSHTAGTTFGQTANYSCNTGYNLVGGHNRTCQATAVWSGNAPTCQVVDCGTLNDPANGQVSHTAGTTFGQTATYTCNTGYRLVGDSNQTCQATGRWSGSAPTCQAVNCGTLTNPINGSVTHTAGTTFGWTATYSCNTGYNLVGGSTRTCQATGEWSGIAPTCQVVDCGALINPANGLVSHSGTTFGQTANYSCNTGYNLVGDNTRTCQATRMWTGSVPTCQAVNCGTLNNPTNGSVTHTAGTTFGQTANYSCNTGYNLVGGRNRTCQATAVWSGNAPTCQVVDCGVLTNPNSGHVSHTGGTTFGQTATYSCNTGYRLLGGHARTCQATGRWSGSAPTCQVVDCGTLTNPASGHVSHTAGTTFGQTATYNCNAGYRLVGDNTRTCQVTGVWSGSAPTCHTTVGNVGELSTSDEGLSTGHIIGISFGILGLLVTIIVLVSIALVKHYINKQRTEREPNSNGHEIPNPMVEQAIADGSMDQQDPMVEEQEIAGGYMDQQGNFNTDARSLNVNGETPATVYYNTGAEDGNFKADAQSFNVNDETQATTYYNEGAENVAQSCKVDGDTLIGVDSHQYDSLEVYRKQHKQPNEQIPLKPVLQYHNPTAILEEDYIETSFHPSDDSNL